MSKQKTIKALEELAKTEYSAATALDAALTDAQDDKLRKNYRRWRDAHINQAEALNKRVKALGGKTSRQDLGDGNLYPIFWSLIRGSHDYKSLAGVRMVAGRGIRNYLSRLEEIEDPKSLDLLRKNLEAKKGEMRWYDHQVVEEHTHELEAELAKTKEAAKQLEDEVKQEKKHGPAAPIAVAAIALAGALGATAFFVVRRNSEQDEDVADAAAQISGAVGHNGEHDVEATAEGSGQVAADGAAPPEN